MKWQVLLILGLCLVGSLAIRPLGEDDETTFMDGDELVDREAESFIENEAGKVEKEALTESSEAAATKPKASKKKLSKLKKVSKVQKVSRAAKKASRAAKKASRAAKKAATRQPRVALVAAAAKAKAREDLPYWHNADRGPWKGGAHTFVNVGAKGRTMDGGIERPPVMNDPHVPLGGFGVPQEPPGPYVTYVRGAPAADAPEYNMMPGVEDEERAQRTGSDIEDCTGCRFTWLQVEMAVGSSRAEEHIYDAFVASCKDQQRTALFFGACKQMFRKIDYLIKDFMNGFTVNQMCEGAAMCR